MVNPLGLLGGGRVDGVVDEGQGPPLVGGFVRGVSDPLGVPPVFGGRRERMSDSGCSWSLPRAVSGGIEVRATTPIARGPDRSEAAGAPPMKRHAHRAARNPDPEGLGGGERCTEPRRGSVRARGARKVSVADVKVSDADVRTALCLSRRDTTPWRWAASAQRTGFRCGRRHSIVVTARRSRGSDTVAVRGPWRVGLSGGPDRPEGLGLALGRRGLVQRGR